MNHSLELTHPNTSQIYAAAGK